MKLEKFFLGMQGEMLDSNEQFPLALQIMLSARRKLLKK